MSEKPISVERITFDKLEDFFKKRIFAIPDIQREFVWDKKKIVKLLDSIKKHYPIGSFLICRVPSRKHKKIRESNALPHFDEKRNRQCYLVIDGQQRLSVIYSVIFGKKIPTTRYQYPIDATSICLSQSQSQESEFEFYDTSRGNAIKLTELLSDKDFVSTQKKGRIKDCRRAFKNYSFPFIFIDGFNEKKMKEAFIRLNKGGTSLSTVDKIFAESYHKDTDLRNHVNNLVEHSLKNGFQYIDKIHIVKAITANLGHKDFVGSTLSTFAKKLANPNNNYHKEYIKKHKAIEESIKLAADFLTVRFKHATYIPYPAMVSILSVFFYANKNHTYSTKQGKELEKWFWVTGFTERYSGSKQRFNLLNDADEMKKLALKKNYKIDLEGKQRSEKISLNRLSKIRYNTRGAVRNTFLCYLISKKPREFFNGEPIPIKDNLSSVFNSKNDHHIFPRALLKKYLYSDEINKIINICFLKFGENIRIKDYPPWIYLSDYRKRHDFRKIMASNVIPHDSCVLSKGDIVSKYKSFLKMRMDLISNDLVRLIGTKYVAFEE